MESDGFDKESKIQFLPNIIKVLRLPQPDLYVNNTITCLHFGPFDNGYILLGTSSGHMLVLNPKNLNRMSSFCMFERKGEGITNICYEPT